MTRPHPSARRELLPQRPREAPVDGAVLPPPPARARRRRPWGRYALLGVCGYCVWIGHLDWRSWTSLRRQEVALARQAAALQAQDAALQARIAYESTPGYVESDARQEFGLVSPGQVPLAPSGPATSRGG